MSWEHRQITREVSSSIWRYPLFKSNFVKTVEPLSLARISSTVGVTCRSRLIALFTALMSTHVRMLFGCFGFGHHSDGCNSWCRCIMQWFNDVLVLQAFDIGFHLLTYVEWNAAMRLCCRRNRLIHNKSACGIDQFAQTLKSMVVLISNVGLRSESISNVNQLEWLCYVKANQR